MRLSTMWLPALIVCLVTGCKQTQSVDENMAFAKNNLVAWCIVPYDNQERNPQQRADMLRELGLNRLAYDWREKHLDSFAEEITVLKQNDIELQSVWFWIDGRSGKLLDKNNEHILSTLRDNNVQTTLWVSFPGHFFEGIDDNQKLEKAVTAIDTVAHKASAIGCKIALYNHGDWFGDPLNQIRIIEALPGRNIGIVYNFHHAHHQIESFPALYETMKPYLWSLNLNGMRPEGPKILPVGDGDRERAMIKLVLDSGFDGDIGILGHIEDEDVKVVLQRNTDGLKAILREYGLTEVAGTY